MRHGARWLTEHAQSAIPRQECEPRSVKLPECTVLSHSDLILIERAKEALEQNLVRMAEMAGARYDAFAIDWRLSTAAERLVQTSVVALQDIARPLARQRGASPDVSGRGA